MYKVFFWTNFTRHLKSKSAAVLTMGMSSSDNSTPWLKDSQILEKSAGIVSLWSHDAHWSQSRHDALISYTNRNNLIWLKTAVLTCKAFKKIAKQASKYLCKWRSSKCLKQTLKKSLQPHAYGNQLNINLKFLYTCQVSIESKIQPQPWIMCTICSPYWHTQATVWVALRGIFLLHLLHFACTHLLVLFSSCWKPVPEAKPAKTSTKRETGTLIVSLALWISLALKEASKSTGTWTDWKRWFSFFGFACPV